MCESTEEMAAQRATFLRRGSAPRARKEGNEIAGLPRDDELVTAVMTVGDLTTAEVKGRGASSMKRSECRIESQ